MMIRALIVAGLSLFCSSQLIAGTQGYYHLKCRVSGGDRFPTFDDFVSADSDKITVEGSRVKIWAKKISFKTGQNNQLSECRSYYMKRYCNNDPYDPCEYVRESRGWNTLTLLPAAGETLFMCGEGSELTSYSTKEIWTDQIAAKYVTKDTHMQSGVSARSCFLSEHP